MLHTAVQLLQVHSILSFLLGMYHEFIWHRGASLLLRVTSVADPVRRISKSEFYELRIPGDNLITDPSDPDPKHCG